MRCLLRKGGGGDVIELVGDAFSPLFVGVDAVVLCGLLRRAESDEGDDEENALLHLVDCARGFRKELPLDDRTVQ